jgi:hypothetical protein
MNTNLKLLLLLLILIGLVFLFIDRVVCNNWTYHDYKAGIERRFICSWQQ